MNTTVRLLLSHADLVSFLVLGILFVFSITCTAVIFSTFYFLRKEKKSLLMILLHARSVKNIEDLEKIARDNSENIGGKYLKHNLHHVHHMLQAKLCSKGLKREFESLDLFLTQSLEHFMLKEERYIPLLGTSAAVSPLIGLFGTVWGLVQAFISIGELRSADITVISPGIAQALVTTLAGLIVAIPALVFYNYFSNEIRKIEHYLVSISDMLLTTVKRTLSSKESLHATK